MLKERRSKRVCQQPPSTLVPRVSEGSALAGSRPTEIGKRSDWLNLFAPVPRNVAIFSFNPSKEEKTKKQKKKRNPLSHRHCRESPDLHVQQTTGECLRLTLCHREKSLRLQTLIFPHAAPMRTSRSALQCLCGRGNQTRSLLRSIMVEILL